MSQENVELVRRSWEAWERGDMEAIFAFYDPDVVWDQFPQWEGELATIYRGHDGIRQVFRDLLETFENFYAHAEDFIDAGDAVVARCRQGGRGKQSGAEVRMPPFWLVYRLRDGRAVRIEVYNDQGEALKAVGLEASAVSRENVEVVRAVWEAWERGDMTALFSLYAPEIVWDMTHTEGELNAEHHGHEGVRTMFRAWAEPFDSYHAHAEEFIEVGEEVVVRLRQGGRGKQSGVEVEMPPYWQVYRVEDGLVSRITTYFNEADALNTGRQEG